MPRPKAQPDSLVLQVLEQRMAKLETLRQLLRIKARNTPRPEAPLMLHPNAVTAHMRLNTKLTQLDRDIDYLIREAQSDLGVALPVAS